MLPLISNFKTFRTKVKALDKECTKDKFMASLSATPSTDVDIECGCLIYDISRDVNFINKNQNRTIEDCIHIGTEGC